MASKPGKEKLLNISQTDESWLTMPVGNLERKRFRKIIDFYLIHTPVEDLSARSRSFSNEYHWGDKSKNDDYKRLLARLEIASKYCETITLKCANSWEDVLPAFHRNGLIPFPNVEDDRECAVFRKHKGGVCESLLGHIRNSLAHSRYAVEEGGKDYRYFFEDIDDSGDVHARLTLRESTLLKWIEIIEAGPFSEFNKKTKRVTKAVDKPEGEQL